MELNNEMFIYDGGYERYHGNAISYMIKLVDPLTMGVTICFRNPGDHPNYRYAREVLRRRYDGGIFKIVKFSEVAKYLMADGVFYNSHPFLDYKNYVGVGNFTHFSTYHYETMFGDNPQFMQYIENAVVIPLAKQIGKEYTPRMTRWKFN